MADVLIRNLDPDLLEQLKAYARENGRSLQSEIHEALRSAGQLRGAHTRELSATWHRRLAEQTFGDSASMIRADRDER